ncbi:Zinc finger protein ZAT5 [Apostasia shenzhenica]|uniref:Zinc finger protein ZAT5 n=1 Tax=Apostasia shenzhenica TaxID=1088818 RepID=A0A2I0AZ86_9ASPA|nr:Zinc finger protein ZAT5 [Apostasia shenzhenica]
MESQQEALGSNSCSSSSGDGPYPSFTRRKRTARQRAAPLPPAAAAAAASSSASSAEDSGITDQEEDMANCLILLAQGRNLPTDEFGGAAPGRFTSRRFAEAATSGGRAGFYLYECKTCFKCFPTFQALGGHRTSHKKPKPAAPAEFKNGAVIHGIEGYPQPISSKPPPPANLTGKDCAGKAKIHECSVCGSEFSSGQALGGHMRRHRPASVPREHEKMKEEESRNVFPIDLNLPAPSDVDYDDDFAGDLRKPLVVFSLVDCHYEADDSIYKLL